ncbi:glycosyltransferase [Flavobacterium johnsoniae]|jgi:glycosyltransferase involved in cell wall biosynthesis|uniref:Candidate alpha-glycosyltransferase Glycosyltransferase family 4 n=1 Tax=Flavobacterium johnsoniae (strain ATCC 17061 / DSM 2064 / JCM 8514 / BCRC 14874 / CCUG 350202 / NBRC 14942 / NCIMB 11054 / UW101) TaxID=376686 RepID=A5FL44_FLAJ1|nr:glycosyltransferase [Flavobacterium johnsoniae]ABQ04069.1 Candidate alpha-glycosyltransferase; Glycosyltransferase family 4 [Flavobacterium johnsoniae UW101]WQG79060.1 glycosyltransferase [Flavobacterium johnsoniae UW101]SHK11485.1 Glycosyltransferase involved in cell wall bisynthesis [Flavobacterium johnsoniae]
MKKALISDWYYVNGGAEKVIHSINSIWDDFDHFALIDFLNDEDRKFILNGKKAKTSFIQKLPTVKKNHRKFLQLFPIAVEQFDLRDYNLIISSSSAVAKGIKTNKNQLHICYCHSPMRYAWDLREQYLKDAGLNKGLKGLYAKSVLDKIQKWDLSNSDNVDFFIANSKHIAERIKKIYNRESTVIYPPVDVDFFSLEEIKEDYYFTASRLVPYKKTQLIVEAFNELPHLKLIVAGDGPELEKLQKTAKNNIEFVGYIENKKLRSLMQKAKAFVFAAEEDFGIIPVEAQACGTPVIALAKGGTLETVIENKTGIFFVEQSAEKIKEAVLNFETKNFDPQIIREHAVTFSKQRFEKEIKEFVGTKYKEHQQLLNKDNLKL